MKIENKPLKAVHVQKFGVKLQIAVKKCIANSVCCETINRKALKCMATFQE